MGRKRKVNRKRIIIRDNCCCRRCGVGIEDTPLEVHHIIPVYLGGSDDPSNLAALCPICHNEVPDYTSVERFTAWLDTTPNHWIVLAVKAGMSDPEQAARDFVKLLKALKDGLAEDEGDLAEFAPYLGPNHHEARARDRSMEWSEV